MKSLLQVVVGFSLFTVQGIGAAEPSFDTWADQFAADWARSHPQLATRTQYFEGAEQDAIDRRLELDRGVKAAREKAALGRRGLKELSRFPKRQLSPIQRTSAAVIRWTCEQAVAEEQFARHKFIFEHYRGVHVTLIHFLTTIHPIRNERDTENYLARLAQVGPLLDEGIAEAQAAATAGFLPPKFIVERSIEQIDNFTTTAPGSNAFVTTLNERLGRLGDQLTGARRRELVAAAEKEVTATVLPAYRRVRDLLASQLPLTTDDAGIWRLPHGKAAYRQALQAMTTTSLSPDEIHKIGRREQERIESEMDVILRKLGHTEGTLEERLQKVKANVRLPSGADPRAAMLQTITDVMRDAERRSAIAFDLRPKAPVIAKREPAITEKTASAHYTPPAPDGSEPGVYWVPMATMDPKYDWLGIGLRTVAYHEAIPGHHFQVALQQETPDLPRYRQRRLLGFNSAYGEGWALYSERLAMENGWYENDLVGQLGYLGAQLKRARRLVVDTGLHAKKWTRQQVIDYGISPQETERYIVRQGQACAYMIGQLRILELRERARKKLGVKFDIKEFHNSILSVGCVPLDVLEKEVDAWIAGKRKSI